MAAVVDIAVRAFVVLSLAWIAAAALRRRPASAGALVWTAAFAGLLALPLYARLAPAWHIAIWQAPIVIEAPEAPVVQRPFDAAEPAPVRARRPSPVDAVGVKAAVAPLSAPASAEPVDWSFAALLASALLTSLLLARIAASHVCLSRLIAGAKPAEDDWTALVDALRPARGIRRAVGVRITEAINVPAIVGVFRPTLLLPAEAAAWDADLRRAVVLHELAHVARWDALAQLLGQIACAVYWFIPLAWHGARRAAALRERASDDEVIRAGVPAPAYAQRLLDLVRGAGAADRHLATVAMARPSRMRERVLAILDPVARREGMTMRKVAAALILSSGAVAAIAAAAPASPETFILHPAAMTQPEPGTARVFDSPRDTTAPAIAKEPAPAETRGTQPAAALCSDGANHTHISGDKNGRRTLTVKLSGAGCKVELTSEGRFQFTPDFTDIASMDGGGFFRVDVTQDGVRRQLDIESRNGSLTRTWRVDGRELPYDAAARAWFAAFLIDLDRRSAIGVDVRVPHLLRQGGVTAVLDETGLMGSDHARSVYYTRLAKAATLSPADVTRVLQQAARLTKSDHYAHEIIRGMSAYGIGDPAQRAAVTELVGGMDSDHYMAESISVLMAAGRPGPGEMDFLVRMLPRMKSDHYKVQTLTKVVDSGSLTSPQLALLAKAAAGVDGDHYATEFLKRLVGTGALTADVRQAFLDAAGRIQGDHYRSETLRRLLDVAELGERELLAVIESARRMSDHYESETLRKVLAHRSATDRVRDAAVAAAEQMSSHYRNEVVRSAGRRR